MIRDSGISHERYQNWHKPSIEQLYNLAQADESMDSLAEVASGVNGPRSLTIHHPDTESRSMILTNFTYPNRIEFDNSSPEYTYVEKGDPGLHRVRGYMDYMFGGASIWGEYEDEEEAREAIRQDCAGRIFLRLFSSEQFAENELNQNTWRIRQALNPDTLSTVAGILSPHSSYIDEKGSHSEYGSNVRYPTMYNLVVRIAEYTGSHPQEEDAMLATLLESALELACDGRVAAESQSLQAALSQKSLQFRVKA